MTVILTPMSQALRMQAGCCLRVTWRPSASQSRRGLDALAEAMIASSPSLPDPGRLLAHASGRSPDRATAVSNATTAGPCRAAALSILTPQCTRRCAALFGCGAAAPPFLDVARCGFIVRRRSRLASVGAHVTVAAGSCVALGVGRRVTSSAYVRVKMKAPCLVHRP